MRYILVEEFGTTMATCLTAAGWKAAPNGDGTGYGVDFVPDSQQAVFDLAEWGCQAQYTVNPRLGITGDPPPQALRMQWEYTRDVVIPCLAAHGHAATAALPTVESFVSSHGDWDGYPQLLGDALHQLEKAYPGHVPTALVLGQS